MNDDNYDEIRGGLSLVRWSATVLGLTAGLGLAAFLLTF